MKVQQSADLYISFYKEIKSNNCSILYYPNNYWFFYFNMMERQLERFGSDSRCFTLSAIVEPQIIYIFSIAQDLVIKSSANFTSCSLPVNPLIVTNFNSLNKTKWYISRFSQNIDLGYRRIQSQSSEETASLFTYKTQLYFKHHNLCKKINVIF